MTMAKEREWNYKYSTQKKVEMERKKNNGTNSTIVYVNPAI